MMIKTTRTSSYFQQIAEEINVHSQHFKEVCLLSNLQYCTVCLKYYKIEIFYAEEEGDNGSISLRVFPSPLSSAAASPVGVQ